MQNLLAKPVIEKMSLDLIERTKRLKIKLGRAPHLSVVLIGDDSGSHVYVRNKGLAAEKIGFHETIFFPADATSSDVVKKRVKELSTS